MKKKNAYAFYLHGFNFLSNLVTSQQKYVKGQVESLRSWGKIEPFIYSDQNTNDNNRCESNIKAWACRHSALEVYMQQTAEPKSGRPWERMSSIEMQFTNDLMAIQYEIITQLPFLCLSCRCEISLSVNRHFFLATAACCLLTMVCFGAIVTSGLCISMWEQARKVESEKKNKNHHHQRWQLYKYAFYLH